MRTSSHWEITWMSDVDLMLHKESFDDVAEAIKRYMDVISDPTMQRVDLDQILFVTHRSYMRA